MKTKYLTSLLATTAIAFLATPVYGESNVSSEPTFFCQTSNEQSTTLAKTKNGEVLPVFHWHQATLPANINLQQTCDLVSEKLDDYLVANQSLSTASFKGAKLDNIPVICLAGANNECQLVLLTLAPAEKPVSTANEVLESILDPKLQTNRVVSRERGLQSTAYPISFWQLLGLKF